MTVDRWCPTCRENVAVGGDGRCPWCETPTELPPRRRRRGGKPRGKYRRLNDAQLRVLYQAHRQGASINALGKRIYKRFGFASANGAGVAIAKGFKELGLPARGRIEQVKLTCTKHGLKPKHGPVHGYAAYKRNVLNGQPDQPRCKAVRTQYPRKGQPCRSRSLVDSDYCYQHDPRYEAKRVAHLAKMRAKLDREAA